jgi:hypothetical protein
VLLWCTGCIHRDAPGAVLFLVDRLLLAQHVARLHDSQHHIDSLNRPITIILYIGLPTSLSIVIMNTSAVTLPVISEVV